MKCIWIAGALLGVISVPAASDEYYVVRDLATKRCSVLESPPATTELALVANGRVYFERSEAERTAANACTATKSSASSLLPTHGKPPPLQLERQQAKKSKTRTVAKKLPIGVTQNTRYVGNQDPNLGSSTLFR